MGALWKAISSGVNSEPRTRHEPLAELGEPPAEFGEPRRAGAVGRSWAGDGEPPRRRSLQRASFGSLGHLAEVSFEA
jgi:hypothetical protein